jgi:predicted Zn-dependent protease
MSAARAGFELFYQHQFGENTQRIIQEATDLLDAPEIDEDRADIIIGGGHLALQLHESVGHATRLTASLVRKSPMLERPLSSPICWVNSTMVPRF